MDARPRARRRPCRPGPSTLPVRSLHRCPCSGAAGRAACRSIPRPTAAASMTRRARSRSTAVCWATKSLTSASISTVTLISTVLPGVDADTARRHVRRRQFGDRVTLRSNVGAIAGTLHDDHPEGLCGRVGGGSDVEDAELKDAGRLREAAQMHGLGHRRARHQHDVVLRTATPAVLVAQRTPVLGILHRSRIGRCRGSRSDEHCGHGCAGEEPMTEAGHSCHPHSMPTPFSFHGSSTSRTFA